MWGSLHRKFQPISSPDITCTKHCIFLALLSEQWRRTQKGGSWGEVEERRDSWIIGLPRQQKRCENLNKQWIEWTRNAWTAARSPWVAWNMWMAWSASPARSPWVACGVRPMKRGVCGTHLELYCRKDYGELVCIHALGTWRTCRYIRKSTACTKAFECILDAKPWRNS